MRATTSIEEKFLEEDDQYENFNYEDQLMESDNEDAYAHL